MKSPHLRQPELWTAAGILAALLPLALGSSSLEARKEAPKASEPATEAKAKRPWEIDNPVVPLPRPPLGTQVDFGELRFQVTSEKVRLGRWLFYDGRLSADGTVSCASCHRPDSAFSEPTPHSTGVGGKTGNRKAPPIINAAFPFYPVYFWDGRAGSLQEQAKGPMANPIEMASTHEKVVATISSIAGYRQAFRDVYGGEGINLDRIVEAIAAYEATRLSGNSAFDRYEAGDKTALSTEGTLGRELFFGKAECVQCHVGWNLTDSKFHNLGIGWDPSKKEFADVGRSKISRNQEDTGAFKTPTLRDVSKRAPYMHDGSIPTLREVVEHYIRGGIPNPWLSPSIHKLSLSSEERDALVGFLRVLDGEGYQDTVPKSFPQ